MGKKAEKKGIVATNPLVESDVGKMIQVIRGKQVLLDRDLATLYEVETKYINRAVKRNPNRFPDEYPDSPMQVLPSYGMHDRFLLGQAPTVRLSNAHASVVAAFALNGCIDDTAYHFGASLKDLGKNTFFFTQEDFTLDEVLKESQKKKKSPTRLSRGLL